MIRRVTFVVLALAGVTGAHAADYTGNDWLFNYNGNLVVDSTTSAGQTLGLSAGLVLGSVTANNQAVSVTQSNAGTFTANGISLPVLGGGLLLGGPYSGNESGSSVSLSRPAILGAGVTIPGLVGANLNVPGLQLNGSLTGVNSDVTSAFGARAYELTGDAFASDLDNIGLRGSVLGIQTDLGVLRLDTQSWSMTRAVPEPTSLCAFGVGAVAFLRRRRKAKEAI